MPRPVRLELNFVNERQLDLVLHHDDSDKRGYRVDTVLRNSIVMIGAVPCVKMEEVNSLLRRAFSEGQKARSAHFHELLEDRSR
jgi:hypothetical protein